MPTEVIIPYCLNVFIIAIIINKEYHPTPCEVI
jgi:hypothetical protein